MTTPSAHTDHASEQDYIRDTLHKRPLFCFFPEAMEAEFLEKRVESSQYYIRSGQWLLLAIFMALLHKWQWIDQFCKMSR
jgi:hypothetical protein